MHVHAVPGALNGAIWHLLVPGGAIGCRYGSSLSPGPAGADPPPPERANTRSGSGGAGTGGRVCFRPPSRDGGQG